MRDGINNVLIDGEGSPVYGYAWSPLRCEKLITFTGAVDNTWGDHDGTADGGAIFTVTGTVRTRTIGICETSLVGAATIELGLVGDTAAVIAQVADAEDIDVNDIWHDNTPDKAIEASTVGAELIIANGLDIILTIGTANITAGAIRFLCSWYPLSANASVVPSTN